MAIAFEQHFERTPAEPDGFERSVMNDPESDYVWYRRGDEATEATQWAADIPDQAAENIQKILEEENANDPMDSISGEAEFDEESHYQLKEHSDESWQQDGIAFRSP